MAHFKPQVLLLGNGRRQLLLLDTTKKKKSVTPRTPSRREKIPHNLFITLVSKIKSFQYLGKKGGGEGIKTEQMQQIKNSIILSILNSLSQVCAKATPPFASVVTGSIASKSSVVVAVRFGWLAMGDKAFPGRMA